MTKRYEKPRVEDIGSLTELTAGKATFDEVVPASNYYRYEPGRWRGVSGSMSSGFSGATTSS